MKVLKTALVGSIGLILVFGVVFAAKLICNIEVAMREVHLIPYGYRGPVVVFVDEPNGQRPQSENGAVVYNIPPNGVLVTQSKLPDWISSKYYYVTSNGRRVELKAVRQQSEMPDDSIYVFLRTGGGVVDGPIDTLTGRRLGQRQFISYYVGRRSDNLDSMYRAEVAMLNGKAKDLGASYRDQLSKTPTSELISSWGAIRSGCEAQHIRALFFEMNNRLKFLSMKKPGIVRILGAPDELRGDSAEGHLVYYVGRSCSPGANMPNKNSYIDVAFLNNDGSVQKVNAHIY